MAPLTLFFVAEACARKSHRQGGITILRESIFAISPQIRYVALYGDGKLELSERPGLVNASSSESDKYEELIVNPTLLKLVQQRGDIDCGGMRFVLIRYGSFFQFVRPITGGHLSVGMELTASPLEIAAEVEKVLARAGVAAGPAR
jgi:hypothetical protein